MASYLNPQPSNAILDDIANIRELANYNAQSDPSLGSDFPVGAKRFVNIGTTSAPQWQWQRYDGTSWKVVANTATEKLMHNVDMLDGYHASTSAVANTIPVYNANKLLVGGITGNAATATKLATARNLQVGGIASGDAISFNGTAAVTLPINSININNSEDNAIVGVLTAKHGGTGRTDGAAQDIIINSLSGEVKAKAYGKIGQMPSDYLNADLNTLVVPGVYRVNTADGELRHHPMSYPSSFAVVRVEQQGSYITQDYQMYNPMLQFVRKSGDSGATWSGWESMGGVRNGTYTIYISKSGSDSNTGFSSENPVLTIARAVRIAEGLSVGNSTAYVRFCIGEGNWGDVSFRSLPFWLQISPYDGNAPTAYSASLPIFGCIRVYASTVTFTGIVADGVESCYNALAYIFTGYKRIGALQAYNYGNILLASSSSETNVLEMHRQSSISTVPIHAYAGGSIYMNYLTIRLVENITGTAFLAVSQGSFYAFLGRTLIDLNGFTFTGPKCRLDTTAQAYSAESAGARTFFTEVLPGSGVNIFNGAIINGYTVGQVATEEFATLDASVVKLTGDQTIAGVKLFTNALFQSSSTPLWYQQHVDVDKGTKPTSNYNAGTIFTDKNGMSAVNRIGALLSGAYTNGAYKIGLYAYQPVSGSNDYAELSVAYPASGSPFAVAPTTPAGSTGNVIVTADYLASSNSNVVHRTGNETVAGEKTFTNVMRLKRAAPNFYIQDTNKDRVNGVSANSFSRFYFQDKNGENTGEYQNIQRANGRFEMRQVAYQQGGSSYAALGLVMDADGTSFASAPTPAADVAATQIVTAAWVRGKGVLINSWKSGNNWYRKYSDGWIEQGGRTTPGDNKTVNFNTAFSSKVYNVTVQHAVKGSSGAEWWNCSIIKSWTLTSFTAYLGGSADSYFWYACGY